jgi:hypothetical protein
MTFSANSGFQPIEQGGGDLRHFSGGKYAELSLELYGRNRLDLLQVEGAGFEKRFWDRKFPTVPRRAVVWRKTVTRSNSSSAGAPVRSSAGRTFAAIPKSIHQASPRLNAAILVLHTVEHHCTLRCSLIARFDICIFGGQLDQTATNQPFLCLGELWQFFNYFCSAHGVTIFRSIVIVRRKSYTVRVRFRNGLQSRPVAYSCGARL